MLENAKDCASMYRLETMCPPAARNDLPDPNNHIICQTPAEMPIDSLLTQLQGHARS